MLKLLESVSQYDWTLRMAGAVLIIDALMAKFGGSDFVRWDWAGTLSLSGVSTVVAGVLFYSICVSIVSPSLEFIFGSAALRFSQPHDYRKKRALGFVTADELEEKADEDQSGYLKQKVLDARAQNDRARCDMARLSRTSFATLFGLLFNLLVSTTGSPTAYSAVTSALPEGGYYLLQMALVVVLCLPAWSEWTSIQSTIWIRHMPLYR
ncbi:hypothetical protein [Pandoraea apista]|uniref:hypothetical protein n=1 Tax=Pandoraea apista TaxID=93218 RepID=UPI00248E98A6|nr:hypothetical protein [Pandoraea apista]